MRILASLPGRNGDQLWSLPTVRALAESYDQSITICLSAKYAGLQSLIAAQPYVEDVLVLSDWVVEESAPISPRIPPTLPDHDRHFPLGYAGWPTPDLPRDIYRNALLAYEDPQGLQPLDLKRPWIAVLPNLHIPLRKVVVGFTDEHFELKYGLVALIARDLSYPCCLCADGSRWQAEGERSISDWFDVYVQDWVDAAQTIRDAGVFLGCCSALHVLAVAIGTPVVLMEPNPQRWNDVFYPLGKTGRVRLVLGGDGQPTFDARHCADVIREVMLKEEAAR